MEQLVYFEKYVKAISPAGKVYYPLYKVHGEMKFVRELSCKTATEAIERTRFLQETQDMVDAAKTTDLKAKYAQPLPEGV